MMLLTDHTGFVSLAKVSSVQLSPLTVANLPANRGNGTVAYVIDSSVNTWGATVVGGGTFKVLVWYNSAHWTVFGI